MLEGLMQDVPLTLQHVLERLRRVNWDGEVVTLEEGGECTRLGYGELCERVDRLVAALGQLGVREGERVGSLGWNTQRHLELYLAVPCAGAVLHTLNLRLPSEQLSYIINHAEDQVVFVDDNLVRLVEPLADQLPSVRHWVVMGDGDVGSLPNAVRYEDLLASADPGAATYPRLDERAASGMCYTSGTTGNPKGVLYSHRSTLLHALNVCTVDTLAISRRDRVLTIVPMFHVNAWGTPYAALLAGADLIMPNRFLQAEPLAKLIEAERVTIAPAVPTVWRDLLAYADEHHPDLSSLRMVPCGGSAVPQALMRAFEERHGVRIIQAWGMTETSPLASIAWPPEGVSEEEHWRLRSTAGRFVPLVDVRIVGDEGEELPWDGTATGEVEIAGPFIASDYYEDPSSGERFDQGRLRTGDVAAIDERGFLRITDRAKDVVKSGGEWISTVDLENELMAHPAVVEAAVIARPDERWGERPLPCVVVRPGEDVTPDDLREHLAERVPRWWLPESIVFVDEVPKTSVGKFDKKVLRAQLKDGELSPQEAQKAAS